MLKIVIRPKAVDDLVDILIYGEDKWGTTQAELYQTALDNGIRRLIDFPDPGKAYADLSPALRAIHVGRHLVFYERLANSIEIVRVLHDRAYPLLHIGSA